ncbi:MAG: hypothetical protein ACFBSD_07150 [Paracoccaceae bacterium]
MAEIHERGQFIDATGTPSDRLGRGRFGRCGLRCLPRKRGIALLGNAWGGGKVKAEQEADQEAIGGEAGRWGGARAHAGKVKERG